MKIIFQFIYSIILVMKISSIHKFYRYLEKYEEDCITEYFSDLTLVVFEIKSESDQVKYSIYGPDGKMIQFKERVDLFKWGFTTNNGGHYKACVLNLSKKRTKVEYHFKFGIAAKDYSYLSKQKDLRPLDINVL
jgi:hypothetical protein